MQAVWAKDFAAKCPTRFGSVTSLQGSTQMSAQRPSLSNQAGSKEHLRIVEVVHLPGLIPPLIGQNLMRGTHSQDAVWRRAVALWMHLQASGHALSVSSRQVANSRFVGHVGQGFLGHAVNMKRRSCIRTMKEYIT